MRPGCGKEGTAISRRYSFRSYSLGRGGDWNTGKVWSLSSMVYKTPPLLSGLSKVWCFQKGPGLGVGEGNLRKEAV